MNTQNVNTAAPESSGRWGENLSAENARIARGLAASTFACLQDGVSFTVSCITVHGDAQAEIRRCGELVWRAWSFEPEFMPDLMQNLRSVMR